MRQSVKIIIFDIIYVASMTAISWIIIFCVDFLRISNKCDPLLCVQITESNDKTGVQENYSKKFLGLGYKILKYKSSPEDFYRISPW